MLGICKRKRKGGRDCINVYVYERMDVYSYMRMHATYDVRIRIYAGLAMQSSKLIRGRAYNRIRLSVSVWFVRSCVQLECA